MRELGIAYDGDSRPVDCQTVFDLLDSVLGVHGYETSSGKGKQTLFFNSDGARRIL